MAEAALLEYSVMEQAAEWFALLAASNVSAADRLRWQRWLDAAPAHRAAWRQVEETHHQLDALPRRRRGLKMLLLVCAAGIGVALGLERREVRDYLAARNADRRTGVGKVAVLPLPDHSQAWLNSYSAVDVAYQDSQRLIILRRGEILLHSGADYHTPPRPLVVEVRGQRLRALGTRFSVRMTAQGARLAVYQGAVEIGTHTAVTAGWQVDIIDGHVGALRPASEGDAAWAQVVKN